MVEENCVKSPYAIPQLYVEDVVSDIFLEIRDGVGEVTSRCSNEKDAICLGKQVYGSTIDFIDLIEKRVTKSFVVVLPPEYNTGLFVQRGSAVEPIPVEGIRVALEVCEGVKVKKWDTLGVVLTRKREMRRIKTHVAGIVVYIYSSPIGEREEDIVIIAPEEVVKYIKIQRR